MFNLEKLCDIIALCFPLFCVQLSYDHQVLLDYLISKDTGASSAEYLLKYVLAFLISFLFPRLFNALAIFTEFLWHLAFFLCCFLGACVQLVIHGTYLWIFHWAGTLQINHLWRKENLWWMVGIFREIYFLHIRKMMEFLFYLKRNVRESIYIVTSTIALISYHSRRPWIVCFHWKILWIIYIRRICFHIILKCFCDGVFPHT